MLYIFGNLQSLYIWTREVKSIAVFSNHDILAGMYLGLLHKIKNVCKHAKETVYNRLPLIIYLILDIDMCSLSLALTWEVKSNKSWTINFAMNL